MGDKSVRDYLQTEIDRHVAAARVVTRQAEDRNESLNEDERKQVEEHVAQATSLKARVQELQDNEDMKVRIDALSGATKTSKESKAPIARTVGDQFVASEAYQALAARGLGGSWTTGPIELKGVHTRGFKTVGDDIVDEVSASDELLGAPQVIPGIVPIFTDVAPYKLTLAELFGQGVATTNAIVFLRESLVDDDAYLVAEKAEKPSSYIEFDKTSATVEKLATWLAVSDEMLEDAPQVASYINSRLALFIRRAEEARLLQLLDNAVSQTSAVADFGGGTNMFDAIYVGITEVRMNGGLEPDAFLIHPQDDAEMSISKSATDGNYFSGGPYAPPNQNPWGLRKVVTSVASTGVAILGAFREGATVWRRGGVTVEASNSHSDFFKFGALAAQAA